MMNVEWQTGVVMVCVAVAAAALLRTLLQRWRAPADLASNPPATGDSAVTTRPSTCGTCRGCSSGGCH